jgi:membrane protease YdiL (CAAX protease family)
VSVVCSRPDAESGYHDTKWNAEELVRASGLPFTILKPGVIHGPGDDMIAHLVKMIRFASLFPIVGRGEALLQPVDVRDVARAVGAALECDAAVGGTYDVVGPERLPLRQVVRTVAEGVGLPLRIVPTPIALMRPAVRLMAALSARPLSTPAQLRMLEEGLIGDPEPARRDLDLTPRPLMPERVRQVAAAVPSLFGLSLRLLDSADQVAWLRRHASQAKRALALAVIAIAVPTASAWLTSGVWLGMGLSAAVLLPLAFTLVRPRWRELLSPSWGGVAMGFLWAAVLYAAGAAAVAMLSAWPAAHRQIAILYAWKEALPGALALPLLCFIVFGEEIVWRNAITLPLAARFGPVRGILVAATGFAAAHAALGVPLLVPVAFLAGGFWSALVVRTRSAVPAFVCHVLWDLAVLFIAPYGGGRV